MAKPYEFVSAGGIPGAKRCFTTINKQTVMLVINRFHLGCVSPSSGELLLSVLLTKEIKDICPGEDGQIALLTEDSLLLVDIEPKIGRGIVQPYELDMIAEAKLSSASFHAKMKQNQKETESEKNEPEVNEVAFSSVTGLCVLYRPGLLVYQLTDDGDFRKVAFPFYIATTISPIRKALIDPSGRHVILLTEGIGLMEILIFRSGGWITRGEEAVSPSQRKQLGNKGETTLPSSSRATPQLFLSLSINPQRAPLHLAAYSIYGNGNVRPRGCPVLWIGPTLLLTRRKDGACACRLLLDGIPAAAETQRRSQTLSPIPSLSNLPSPQAQQQPQSQSQETQESIADDPPFIRGMLVEGRTIPHKPGPPGTHSSDWLEAFVSNQTRSKAVGHYFRTDVLVRVWVERSGDGVEEETDGERDPLPIYVPGQHMPHMPRMPNNPNRQDGPDKQAYLVVELNTVDKKQQKLLNINILKTAIHPATTVVLGLHPCQPRYYHCDQSVQSVQSSQAPTSVSPSRTVGSVDAADAAGEGQKTAGSPQPSSPTSRGFKGFKTSKTSKGVKGARTAGAPRVVEVQQLLVLTNTGILILMVRNRQAITTVFRASPLGLDLAYWAESGARWTLGEMAGSLALHGISYVSPVPPVSSLPSGHERRDRGGQVCEGADDVSCSPALPVLALLVSNGTSLREVAVTLGKAEARVVEGKEQLLLWTTHISHNSDRELNDHTSPLSSLSSLSWACGRLLRQGLELTQTSLSNTSRPIGLLGGRVICEDNWVQVQVHGSKVTRQVRLLPSMDLLSHGCSTSQSCQVERENERGMLVGAVEEENKLFHLLHLQPNSPSSSSSSSSSLPLPPIISISFATLRALPSINRPPSVAPALSAALAGAVPCALGRTQEHLLVLMGSPALGQACAAALIAWTDVASALVGCMVGQMMDVVKEEDGTAGSVRDSVTSPIALLTPSSPVLCASYLVYLPLGVSLEAAVVLGERLFVARDSQGSSSPTSSSSSPAFSLLSLKAVLPRASFAQSSPSRVVGGVGGVTDGSSHASLSLRLIKPLSSASSPQGASLMLGTSETSTHVLLQHGEVARALGWCEAEGAAAILLASPRGFYIGSIPDHPTPDGEEDGGQERVVEEKRGEEQEALLPLSSISQPGSTSQLQSQSQQQIPSRPLSFGERVRLVNRMLEAVEDVVVHALRSLYKRPLHKLLQRMDEFRKTEGDGLGLARLVVRGSGPNLGQGREPREGKDDGQLSATSPVSSISSPVNVQLLQDALAVGLGYVDDFHCGCGEMERETHTQRYRHKDTETDTDTYTEADTEAEVEERNGEGHEVVSVLSYISCSLLLLNQLKPLISLTAVDITAAGTGGEAEGDGGEKEMERDGEEAECFPSVYRRRLVASLLGLLAPPRHFFTAAAKHRDRLGPYVWQALGLNAFGFGASSLPYTFVAAFHLPELLLPFSSLDLASAVCKAQMAASSSPAVCAPALIVAGRVNTLALLYSKCGGAKGSGVAGLLSRDLKDPKVGLVVKKNAWALVQRGRYAEAFALGIMSDCGVVANTLSVVTGLEQMLRMYINISITNPLFYRGVYGDHCPLENIANALMKNKFYPLALELKGCSLFDICCHTGVYDPIWYNKKLYEYFPETPKLKEERGVNCANKGDGKKGGDSVVLKGNSSDAGKAESKADSFGSDFDDFSIEGSDFDFDAFGSNKPTKNDEKKNTTKTTPIETVGNGRGNSGTLLDDFGFGFGSENENANNKDNIDKGDTQANGGPHESSEILKRIGKIPRETIDGVYETIKELMSFTSLKKKIRHMIVFDKCEGLNEVNEGQSIGGGEMEESSEYTVASTPSGIPTSKTMPSPGSEIPNVEDKTRRRMCGRWGMSIEEIQSQIIRELNEKNRPTARDEQGATYTSPRSSTASLNTGSATYGSVESDRITNGSFGVKHPFVASLEFSLVNGVITARYGSSICEIKGKTKLQDISYISFSSDGYRVVATDTKGVIKVFSIEITGVGGLPSIRLYLYRSFDLTASLGTILFAIAIAPGASSLLITSGNKKRYQFTIYDVLNAKIRSTRDATDPTTQ